VLFSYACVKVDKTVVLEAEYDRKFPFFHVYVNTDNAATGFQPVGTSAPGGGFGAEFVIENDKLYPIKSTSPGVVWKDALGPQILGLSQTSGTKDSGLAFNVWKVSLTALGSPTGTPVVVFAGGDGPGGNEVYGKAAPLAACPGGV